MSADTSIQKIYSALGLPIAAGSFSLGEYQSLAARTDQSGKTGLAAARFFALGLISEIGELVSTLKKKQREKNAYFAYTAATIEELGDSLWYFSNLLSVYRLSLESLTQELALNDKLNTSNLNFEDLLFVLSESRADLTKAVRLGGSIHDESMAFMSALIAASQAAEVPLEKAALENLQKVADRWPVKRDYGKLFDEKFHDLEQLPRHLEVDFVEREISGKIFTYQTHNGLPLGDRLTDNSDKGDFYRYHDVFHLSYAAILGWSPTLRALMRLKRKSDPETDEREDGARAIITEEGISNWIFSYAAQHNYFEGVTSLEFDILKIVRTLTKGYEVEARPLWMWEEAILKGFEVFRQLRENRGGIVTIDLTKRMISYGPREPEMLKKSA